MKDLNSRFLSTRTLAAIAATGVLAFGCVNNGSDTAYRDDAKTTPDTTSGTTSSAYDASTVSGTTAAPPVPATGAAPATATAPTTGTTTDATAVSHDDHAATTPDHGKMTADAKKKPMKKKMDKKMEKHEEPAKADSSSNTDFGAAGTVGAYENEDLNDEAGTEIDESVASTPNWDEEGTTSGATTDVNETPAHEETAQSTASASDEDLRRASRLAGSLSPWYTEPYSRIPTRTGSPTGKDKNLAAIEGFNVFIDPPAFERALLTRESIRPVTEIDFNSFGYDRRERFASQMNSRLANIDARLDVLDANQDIPQYQVAPLEHDQDALSNELEDIRKVGKNDWDSFRDGFRNRLTALEREVAHLSVSAR